MNFIHTLLLCLLFIVLGCSGRFTNNAINKSGSFAEFRAVDWSQVYFEDLDSGNQVSVSQYMEEHDKDYLLMLFGSVGCAKCNEKAYQLTHKYLSTDRLFLQSDEHRFDLVGVNTDSGGARGRFLAIMANESLRLERGYNFIKWADPAGYSLKTKILVEGERFGVPYTMLINRNGILWSYSNQESYTLDALLNRVRLTLAGNDPGKNPSPDPSDDGNNSKPGGSFPKIDIDPLAIASPYRFQQLELVDCKQNIQSMNNISHASRHLLVQVSRERCSPHSACFENLQRLSALKLTEVSLVPLTQQAPDNQLCALMPSYQVRQDFFKVFSSLFDWQWPKYLPEMGPWQDPVRIPQVNGPLVLLFSKETNELLWAAEGKLESEDLAQLQQVIGSMQPQLPINTTALWRPSINDVTSAQTTRVQDLIKTEYTVMIAFDRYCDSCVQELAHWSHHHLLDFCGQEPGFCAVYAIEEQLASTSGMTNDELYREIEEVFASYTPKVRVPFLLETEVFGDGYGRLFNSYWAIRFPEWNGYGAVVYDREGKIIAAFRSQGPQDPDPILSLLKDLLALKKGAQK